MANGNGIPGGHDRTHRRHLGGERGLRCPAGGAGGHAEIGEARKSSGPEGLDALSKGQPTVAGMVVFSEREGEQIRLIRLLNHCLRSGMN